MSEKIKGFFGPYDMKQELDEAVQAISQYYLLAQCKGKYDQTCCMAYLKKECLAPCYEKIIMRQYEEQLQKSVAFFKNEEETILTYYTMRMHQAATQLEFEKAQYYKGLHESLTRLIDREKAIAWGMSQRKIVAYIPHPLGGIKVYLLLGSQIVKTFHIQEKKFRNTWNCYFESKVTRRESIDKRDVVEAYIIYIYLHRNNACEWFEIKN